MTCSAVPEGFGNHEVGGETAFEEVSDPAVGEWSAIRTRSSHLHSVRIARDWLGIRGGQRISVYDVVGPNRRAPEPGSL